MFTKNVVKKLAVSCLLLTFNAASAEFEFSGKLGLEERYFVDGGQYSEQQYHSQTSLFAVPEFYWGWNNGSDTLVFKPFYRIDSQDGERTHGDVRELYYIHASDDWELRAGIRKEFWGVTEFQHLVDVINQTDSVEDFDGEDKIGQLMLNLSLVKDWGIIDLYLLPGFRQRTFPGGNGRLRGPFQIDKHNISYESDAKKQHLDLAMRWTHSLGDFDIGSYWFHGTNREPDFIPNQDGETLQHNLVSQRVLHLLTQLRYPYVTL
ncbi:hypothetical protein ACMAZF_05200 [Psychrobium sp. nBUS_13]|uniref:hypothetical protein n=1 Tax=Psychrobium sp. nBUS_13 TaxID=3395319 RepID=UPI003EBBA829